MNIAVFPGSFDPVTKGHEDIIRRALPLFDRLHVAVGINSEKKSFFPIEERMAWLKECFCDEKKIEISAYEGLTIHFCRTVGARFMLRGIRNSADFRYEKDIAQTNRQMAPEIETIFLATAPQFAHISSGTIRDIYRNKGDYKQFMPDKLRK